MEIALSGAERAGKSQVQLYEFAIDNGQGESRYFISCANERAALQAAHRLASHSAVKVFKDGALVGEAQHTKWRWNIRRLLQNPHYKAQL